MNKEKKGISFSNICIMVGIIPMVVAVLIVSFSLTSSLKSSIKEGIENELKVAAEQVNQYFAYDVIANGVVDYEEYSDHEYIESLKGNDIELTLFQGDTRLLTSLKNEEGSYNEGTQASSDIFAAVKSGQEYSAENVSINGKKYFVYYKPIYDGNGAFWGMAFAGEPETKVNATINSEVRKIVIISVALVVVLLLIIILLSRVLAKTLISTSDSLNRLSEGNLDAKFDFTSIVKEFNSLVLSGNILQKQLLTSVGGAKNASVDLNSAITVVDGLSATSADGAGQIAQVVGEMATTAQSMAETVQDANATVIDMGDSIDRISERIKDMNASSNASIEANDNAMKYMDKLTDASEESARTVDEIGEKIAECSESASKIQSAAVAITEIASQTNLLSLNASIEAARAGEAGRGFAVVATEIQKLAEQSNVSAGEIQSIINEIMDRVNQCVDKADEMNSVIEKQMEFLRETKNKIDDMSVAGKELSDGANVISSEADELAELKEKVLASISDLSAISEENAASSQEATASVENIANAVESTRTESENMRNLASDLNNKMEFFKL